MAKLALSGGEPVKKTPFPAWPHFDDLERRARSIHDCGRMPGQWYYAHFIYGSNYRLSEWQGAVLLEQLARLDAQAAVRRRNAAVLNKALAEIEGITPQVQDPRCTRNGHYGYLFHYHQRPSATPPSTGLSRHSTPRAFPPRPAMRRSTNSTCSAAAPTGSA